MHRSLSQMTPLFFRSHILHWRIQEFLNRGEAERYNVWGLEIDLMPFHTYPVLTHSNNAYFSLLIRKLFQKTNIEKLNGVLTKIYEFTTFHKFDKMLDAWWHSLLTGWSLFTSDKGLHVISGLLLSFWHCFHFHR